MQDATVARLAAALFVACVGTGGFGDTTNAQTVELKVSVFTPPVNPFSVEMERIGKEILAKTNGRLKLNIFHASQMGPAPRQFDLVRAGVADIAVVFHGLTPGRFPMTEIAELPALMGGVGYPAAMAMQGNLNEFLAAEHPGVKVLDFAVTPNPILISRMELRTLADLKGKRIRHPGPVHSATIAALGAVPVLVQPFEMAEALARGQIDGAVTGTGGTVSFKLQDTARFMLEMPMGRLTNAVVMSPAAYDKLPPDLRDAFDDYFGPRGQPSWGRLLDRSEAADRGVLIKDGVKPVALDAQNLAEFNALAIKLQETAVVDLEKKGRPARAYFERLKASMAKYQ